MPKFHVYSNKHHLDGTEKSAYPMYVSKEATGLMGEDGKRSGWWKFYKRGTIDEEVLYVNGFPRQTRRYVYDNLISVVHIGAGGKRLTTIDINGGKPTVSSATRPEIVAGQIIKLKHGVYKEWDFDGNLFLEATFKKDKLHGVTKIYYPNGKVKETCRFKNNSAHGFLRAYHETGELRLAVEYKRGSPKGWQYYWDTAGEKCSSGLWTGRFYSLLQGSSLNRTQLKRAVEGLTTPGFIHHWTLHPERYRLKRMPLRPATFFRRLRISQDFGNSVTVVPLCV